MSMMISNLLFFCVLITPLVQDPQDDPSVSLEKARMIETVDRDYAQALKLYQDLASLEDADFEFKANADLGSARCLMKLGRYEEAKSVLRDPWLCSDELKRKAREMLLLVDRLDAEDRAGSSAADNLVWQLLDAASGTDEKRANIARAEILKMGDLAVPILKELALQPEYFMSVTAFEMLIRIGGDEVVRFIERCTKDPDVVVRKRCLDGAMRTNLSKKHVFGINMTAILAFLHDEEEFLCLPALKFITYFSNTEKRSLTEEQYFELTKSCLEIMKTGSMELQEVAFDCTYRLVKAAGPVERFMEDRLPVDLLSEIVRFQLDSINPQSPLSSDLNEKRTRTIYMGHVLATRFGQHQLFEVIAPYWKYRDYIALDAVVQMGPEALEPVIVEVLDRNDPEEIAWLLKACEPKVVLPLTKEAQYRLLKVRGCISGDDSLFKNYTQPPFPASNWAALVEGELQNQDKNSASNVLIYAGYVPPPQSWQDFRKTLQAWGAHPDPEFRDALNFVVYEWVRRGWIDPGPEGALEIIGYTIHSLGEPIEIIKKDGDYSIQSTQVERILGSLSRCIAAGDVKEIQDWLLAFDYPGLLDAVMFKGDLAIPLIKKSNEFVLEAWPRLSPVGKEYLFSSIYRINEVSMYTVKMTWMVPLLKDWKFDKQWKAFNTMRLVRLLDSILCDELAPLVQEVVSETLKNPVFTSNKDIARIELLITHLPRHLPEKMELLKQWFLSVGVAKASNLKPEFTETITASPQNLVMAMKWLGEDYEPSFKNLIIDSAFSVSDVNQIRGPYKEAGTSEKLSSAWPELDEEARGFLLYKISGNSEASRTCNDLLTGILVDPASKEKWKHQAFVALWISKHPSAVEPLLDYLRSVAPDGDVISELTLEVARRLKKKSHHKSKNILWFDMEAGQRLAIGILQLPEDPSGLRQGAASVVVIRNLEDLEFLMETYRSTSGDYAKSHLLRTIVTFVFNVSAGQANNEPLPENVRSNLELMLKNALPGSVTDNYNVRSVALELIGQYRIESLMSHVGHLAMSHPDDNVRFHAVECLGSFLNTEIVPTLLECLKDSDNSVRNTANSILKRMREYEEQRVAWAALLGEEGAEGKIDSPTEALFKMFRTDDMEVRLAAIKSLGKLGDPATLPMLVQLMAEGTDEEKAAAKAAIDAITAE